jgi:hypothetical protein
MTDGQNFVKLGVEFLNTSKVSYWKLLAAL